MVNRIDDLVPLEYEVSPSIPIIERKNPHFDRTIYQRIWNTKNFELANFNYMAIHNQVPTIEYLNRIKRVPNPFCKKLPHQNSKSNTNISNMPKIQNP